MSFPTRKASRSLLTSLIAACCALALTAASASAIDFEAEGTPIAANNPGWIATDAAGRIYVPLRGSGQVQIFDNARGGNKLLASIGAGQLQDPAAVAIDIRGYIFVADAARNSIVSYRPYYWGAPLLGTSGKGGAALGEFSGLRQIAVDFEPRIYAAEADNGRVQSLDPASGVLTPLFAFGVTDPGGWGPISGIAVDDQERFVVSSASPTDTARLYAPNGAYIGPVESVGTAPGQIKGALGLGFDPLERLLVADTGNDRVQLFSTVNTGLGYLGTFGSSGPGTGQFNAPNSIASAPGALAYVSDAGNNRIVRLRYDDADRDGALDAADKCQGVSNPLQSDLDSDGRGDDCDDDIDGDGFANGADGCPLLRPYTDRNKDGCQDPFSKLSQILKKSGSVTLRGRASGGSLGVARVEVAVARSGKKPHFRRAKGTTRWSLKIKRSALRSGKYRVYVRAVQKQSRLVERPGKARASFRIFR